MMNLFVVHGTSLVHLYCNGWWLEKRPTAACLWTRKVTNKTSVIIAPKQIALQLPKMHGTKWDRR